MHRIFSVVAPLVGARIEIYEYQYRFILQTVAPLVGARIEIVIFWIP